MIIWIIGLSGSGKTTLGNELMNQLNKSKDKWMLMDGDRFRSILGEDLGYDLESRRKVGERLVNLSQEFDRQNQNLIVCVLSLFPEHQKTNRKSIKNYKEIFLDVSLDTLRERDNKGLYKMADKGKMKNIVGIDIPFPRPTNADFIIDNNEDRVSLEETANNLLKELNLQEKSYKYSQNNLFSYKEKYEYTSYEGKRFISFYLNSRSELMSYLDTKIKYLNALYPPGEHNHFLFKKTLPVSNYFIEKELTIKESAIDSHRETKPLLLDWLEIINNDQVDELLFSKILTLLQRFEVSKRLHEGYTIDDIKKVGEIKDSLDVYILFGLLLTEAFTKFVAIERKVILFNTILKVCDLISSVPERLTTPCEIALTKELFEKEHTIYKYIKGHLC